MVVCCTFHCAYLILSVPRHCPQLVESVSKAALAAIAALQTLTPTAAQLGLRANEKERKVGMGGVSGV